MDLPILLGDVLLLKMYKVRLDDQSESILAFNDGKHIFIDEKDSRRELKHARQHHFK